MQKLPSMRIVRSTTVPMTVRIKQNSIPEVLQDYTLHFTVRREIPASSVKDDTTALISKQSGVLGDIDSWTFKLSPLDTNLDPGSYYYDIQVRNPDNDIVSCEPGVLTIIGDITRSFS